MHQGDQLVLTTQDLGGFEERPRVRHAHGFVVVELHGEVDIMAVHHTSPLLDELSSPAEPRIIIDLRATTFCDCSGLGLIARTSRRAQRRGGHVGLVCTSPLQLRILRLTGLATALPPAATVEEAVAQALARPPRQLPPGEHREE